ncbi:uncharacterized protein CcaverHIS019_0102180 [Cutaneotrichosporon cavernicola]|uniref:Uncharacterized protein n=1 Tax=Cutaneotrichosporon cavernicola TaxID=279322 RepID=A0AA48KZY4_9TREE|nr:uncharacterized protein CcaverHIS019_0102180 [Cutaneotrichosporon cavernicola]BEI87500.1 hypothetical protein CcaverHIS019_0102180 [Cutaneotrichosporon cavernicola]
MDKLFRKRTAAKARKGKAKAEPLAPMPPSLNIDIRNSLIMPSMTERFSVLLPSMTAANETSLRFLLEQQRARGHGPSMTREEEDMLLAELQAQNRPRAESNVSSEWDGNPPHFDAEWLDGSRSHSVLTHSSSNPSLLSSESTSPRKGLSPSNSTPFGQALGSGSIMDRTFTRSYGFTGAASFRDNNYLRSVEKEKEKHRGNSGDDHPAWVDQNKSPSYRGKTLPTLPPPDASKGAATLHPDTARTASPSGSERTVTPTPSVQSANMSHAAWKIPRPSEVQEPPSVHVDEAPGPVGTTSTLRQRPVDPRRGQRQSLLMNMSPQQANRISVALFEIETHLRRSTVMEGVALEDHHGERDDDDDREEMLDGEHDEKEPERRPSAASSMFPFTASTASTSRNAFSSSQSDVSSRGHEAPTSPPRATPSPRFDIAPHPASPLMTSPDSHVAPSHFPSPEHAARYTSPPPQPTSQFASPTSQPSSSRVNTSHSNYGHAHSSSIASTVYSEEDYAKPALVPTRPQPARYTPSPAFGVPSAYVPGQPRPVGSMRHASHSSKSSTPTSPPSSQSPGTVDSLARRLNYPAVPGARPEMSSLVRSLSEQHPNGSQSTSQSQTPTPSSTSPEHPPPVGALASRHQTSQSLSETHGASWRTGSPSALRSSPSQTTINEEEQAPVLRSREHSPVLSKKSSPKTLPPSLNGVNSLHRTESIASVSSTWTESNGTGDNVWDRVLNGSHTPQAEPQSCGEEDTAELELLKSMSGIGKEELSLIQERLVEKAKSERDRLRADGETTPVTSPVTTHPNLLPSTPPSYLAYLPSNDSGFNEPQSPLAALAMLPGALPGMPPQPVDPSELPYGPPPPRPAHSSDVVARTQNSTPSLPSSQNQSPTTADHARGESKGRMWLDDDPEAKRDIEKRIANATSDLFRASSGRAHKRSLSKSARKQISSPTLLTYSANVPTVPIANIEDSPHQRTGSTDKPKRKLSLRWKRKGKKSAEGTPPPPSSLPGKFATPSTTQPSTANTPASATSITKSVASPTPAPRKKSETDLNDFRFPNTPSSTNLQKEVNDAPRPVAAQTPAQTQARSLPSVAQVVELAKKTHKLSGSEDSVALARFFESGRAVGLSEAQLQDMLRQNTTLNRSGTNTSSRSHGSTAPTSARSHGQSPQPGSPLPGTMHLGNGVKLQPPASLARMPTPVVEKSDAGSIHSERASSDIADTEPVPVIVRHTVVMVEDMDLRTQTPPQSGFLQTESQKSPTRSNSIRRKPVPITADDRDLLSLSPKSSYAASASSYTASHASHNPGHQRNFSNASYSQRQSYASHQRHLSEQSIESEQAQKLSQHQRTQSQQSTGSGSEWALPPRQFDGAYEGMPDSAGSMRSSAQGSIYDYYGGDGMSPDRASDLRYRDSGSGSVGQSGGYGYGYEYAQSNDSQMDRQEHGTATERPSMTMDRPSMAMERPSMGVDRSSQAVEIMEYSDGRVVWNLVNALRDDAPRPSLDTDPLRPFARGAAMRDSVAESDTESLIEEDLPWRVGPTPTPAFMRRPDTRVYYTSSADVADLIDQLSSDLAGAARGRIDIQPTSPTPPEYPSIEGQLDGQHEPGQFSNAPSPLNVPPKRSASLLRPDAHQAYQAGVAPSGSWTGSDASGGESTVQDRLQALMDRLRTAPGGVGRAAEHMSPGSPN